MVIYIWKNIGLGNYLFFFLLSGIWEKVVMFFLVRFILFTVLREFGVFFFLDGFVYEERFWNLLFVKMTKLNVCVLGFAVDRVCVWVRFSSVCDIDVLLERRGWKCLAFGGLGWGIWFLVELFGGRCGFVFIRFVDRRGFFYGCFLGFWNWNCYLFCLWVMMFEYLFFRYLGYLVFWLEVGNLVLI